MTDLTLVLLYQWLKFFHSFPRWTVGLTVLAAAVIAVGILANLRGGRIQKDQVPELATSAETQIAEIDAIRSSVSGLLIFLEQQRRQVELAQVTIQQLAEEKADLEPVVRAQREAIEQILSLQEQRAESLQEQRAKGDRWRNLAIGFGVGIGGSVIASFIVTAARLGWAKGFARPS